MLNQKLLIKATLKTIILFGFSIAGRVGRRFYCCDFIGGKYVAQCHSIRVWLLRVHVGCSQTLDEVTLKLTGAALCLLPWSRCCTCIDTCTQVHVLSSMSTVLGWPVEHEQSTILEIYSRQHPLNRIEPTLSVRYALPPPPSTHTYTHIHLCLPMLGDGTALLLFFFSMCTCVHCRKKCCRPQYLHECPSFAS